MGWAGWSFARGRPPARLFELATVVSALDVVYHCAPGGGAGVEALVVLELGLPARAALRTVGAAARLPA